MDEQVLRYKFENSLDVELVEWIERGGLTEAALVLAEKELKNRGYSSSQDARAALDKEDKEEFLRKKPGPGRFEDMGLARRLVFGDLNLTAAFWGCLVPGLHIVPFLAVFVAGLIYEIAGGVVAVVGFVFAIVVPAIWIACSWVGVYRSAGVYPGKPWKANSARFFVSCSIFVSIVYLVGPIFSGESPQGVNSYIWVLSAISLFVLVPLVYLTRSTARLRFSGLGEE